MRLFLAICLTEELQSGIIGLLHGLKQLGVGGRYVPASNLHMTLAFLGEVEDVNAVKVAVSTVHPPKFRLALSDWGSFGDTLWIGVKGSQALSNTVKDVREALDRAGIPWDRQKFVPHITVVRHMTGNWKQAPAPRGDMMVRKISLMMSEERNGKRVYTEIYSI